jgi:flagellar hook protein FlgE
MASEVSTIQSLKAVDAWIDVINANINGGVRTAFKSSRLKFAGSNVDVTRAGTTTSSPLQFPEPGLTTANTVIDFSQGAITASTENTHLGIQGDGFFLVVDPNSVDLVLASEPGSLLSSANTKFYLTRDGEFRTDKNGLLVNNQGYYLCSVATITVGGNTRLAYDTGARFGSGSDIRLVYNNMDLALPTGGVMGFAVRLTEFVSQTITDDIGGNGMGGTQRSLVNVNLGKQSLEYSQFGSTVFDFGFRTVGNAGAAGAAGANTDTQIGIASGTSATATVLTKSLEASNASMTQSVPELSLAQKLFSALTKVLQTKQTNVDGVLNLVR